MMASKGGLVDVVLVLIFARGNALKSAATSVGLINTGVSTVFQMLAAV